MQLLNITISRAGGKLVLSPQILEAFAGDQVFWVNNDGQPHQPVVQSSPSNVPLVDAVDKHATSSVFTPEARVDANNTVDYPIDYFLADSPDTKGVIHVTLAP